ncbi:hypothetical protein Calag_0748 [Caldisphaera lagunensis DSM 15908]|uniref:Thioredoxin-like fold domain-containing protein n=1 Tax=Caldisphaera lagunensis (strain DSM 15908 / JCM 11604 / ANMR 0165 / IC-154) TaxID=1056495 RepID=L0ABI2_CALLD|nr:hypothetical protein [Caldisphaera lagunensis]AFZ70492.1 hypothetical protein Calag_0748 [Caldisphaera lagunensis DSM 15908]
MIVVVIAIVIIGGFLAFNKSNKNVTPTSTSSITTSTTSSNLISVTPLLPYINSPLVPTYGNPSSKYYLFIIYDPECPYCAIEFNNTLPYLYYLAKNNYTMLVFVGMPIHQYSLEMIAMLDLIYQKYGFTQFYKILDKDYAIYYYNILLYENNKTSQLQVPTPYTIYMLLNQSNLSINYNDINSTMKDAYNIADLAYTQGIDATPMLIIYNTNTGNTINQFIGLYSPIEIESYLNKTLGVRQ